MVYVIQNNRVILARPHKVMVRYERIRLIHGGDAGVKFIHGFTDKRQTVLVPLLLYNSLSFIAHERVGTIIPPYIQILNPVLAFAV
jgi:hypothetical protein